MELREIIAKNIASLRIDAGLTQLQLAGILNYSDKAVSKWERGESVPDIFMLKRIADYFGVSVDYLLTLDHKSKESPVVKKPKISRRTRLIISSLSTALVWLIATFLFVVINLAIPDANLRGWMMFIYAIPVSAIVLLVFNSIWGIARLNYLIITVLVWSLLFSAYMSVLLLTPYNIWMIFLLGIPAQIIILLWSGFSFKKMKNKEKEGEQI